MLRKSTARALTVPHRKSRRRSVLESLMNRKLLLAGAQRSGSFAWVATRGIGYGNLGADFIGLVD